ncbi:MAG: hypothetical protein KTR32_03305 [Granulosicoccus sp.]|nr:hypothetical protein [Granulosicoccus sp.]
MQTLFWQRALLSKRLLPATGFALLLLAGSAASAEKTDKQTLKAGRAKAQKCVTCHGKSGLETLAKQAGSDKALSVWISKSLSAYKSGKRNSVLMNAISASLSEQDIHQISIWFESVNPR